MEKSQPKYGEYVYKYMFEHDEQGNTIYCGKTHLIKQDIDIINVK